MITFDFTFQPTDPLHWVVLVLLVVYPLGVGVILLKNNILTTRRKVLRAGLNLLFWLLLITYWVQPVWASPVKAAHALLVGKEVPMALARHYQDSLGLNEHFAAEEFIKKKRGILYDSVTLLGQDFPSALLAQVSPAAIRWLPYYTDDQLLNLHWQGIVRQGELQPVSGLIRSSQKQWIKITYAGHTLDSTLVEKGVHPFSLRFPAFSEGRTSTELIVGEQIVDSVRFFTRPLPPLSYQFLLSSPDFESRTLAEWLGKKGHLVTVTTTISKGIQQSTRFNGGIPPNGPPDVIITDATHAATAGVKKALAAWKSVLFINVTEPDLGRINRTLGTRFSTQRISTEAAVPITSTLTAQPYVFTESMPQLVTPRYPAAVWTTTGKIGVSLLNETFPLKLSGDTVAYAQVWHTLLALVRPSLPFTLTAQAPLQKGIIGHLQFNSTSPLPRHWPVGHDTLVLVPSPLNTHSAEATYLFGKPGWTSLGDSAEVYVEDSTSSLYATRQLNAYLRGLREPLVTGPSAKKKPIREAKLPGWAWLLLFILSATALWIEPKWRS
jgi:hypothetical protein